MRQSNGSGRALVHAADQRSGGQTFGHFCGSDVFPAIQRHQWSHLLLGHYLPGCRKRFRSIRVEHFHRIRAAGLHTVLSISGEF